METLAHFRHGGGTLRVTGELAEIKNSRPDHTSPGTVPASWLASRRIGMGSVSRKRYANIYSSEWLSTLRRSLEAELIQSGLVSRSNAGFDLTVLMSQHRSVTQRAATLIQARGYDGIYYQSRHRSDLSNFALFEPFDLKGSSASDLDLNDADFREALDRLNLEFAPGM